MNHHIAGVLLLAAAFVLETLGLGTGAILFLAAGVACEIAFWMRLVRGRRLRTRVPSLRA
jgi:hypothetical protein